jgi:hypothetical protein
LDIVLIAIVSYASVTMTEDEKREAAAYLGENVLWLIEQILIKHNIAIIEASKEAIDAAVKKEREECAKACEGIDSLNDYYGYRIELVCAEAIRARG